jgi:acyl-CoA thioester hydrolase
LRQHLASIPSPVVGEGQGGGARSMNAPARQQEAAQVHSFPIRVYYEDTDAAGVVYYANYLRFAERARTEMLRTVAPEYCDPARSGGIAFAVRHCVADFIQAARLDDSLEVHTHIVNVGGASFSVGQSVSRAGETLVRLDIRLACINRAGRPERIPAGLRALLEELSGSE